MYEAMKAGTNITLAIFVPDKSMADSLSCILADRQFWHWQLASAISDFNLISDFHRSVILA